MATKHSGFSELYNNISQWFEEVKQHELTQAVEIVEQAKAYFVAAENIPTEKVKQFIDSFRYDLVEFYQQNQAEIQSSVYLGLLSESMWQTLANLTDKSQVEWSELIDDFNHDGIYHQGDYIGFGELTCCQCGNKQMVTHLVKLDNCQHCQASQFVRHAFKP